MPDDTTTAPDANDTDAAPTTATGADETAPTIAEPSTDAPPSAPPAEAEKAPKAKGRAGKQELDADELAALAADVSDNMGVTRAQFEALAERLAKSHGLKFRDTSEGRTYAAMAGIEGGSRNGERDALVNWSNAARRALNQMAA